MTHPQRLDRDSDIHRALDRRAILRTGLLGVGALVTGCARPAFAQIAPLGAMCRATDENIEGPYYLPGAPVRSNLVTAGVVGTELTLEGRVMSARCAPIAHALVEVWQADAQGEYDIRGPRLRGTLRTNDDGRYVLHTIVPGRYLNGDRYRPAHIHVKVHAPGRRELTTQLYFAGDPYNAGDPWFVPSLALRPERAGRGLHAQRDLVLR